VGEEGDGRHSRVQRRWHGRDDGPIVGQRDVGRADLPQLVDEQTKEIVLLPGARGGRGRLVALRVDASVPDQPVFKLPRE